MTCPYFGTCGGCTSQNISYDVQLEHKKNALANAINFNDVGVFSDKEYGYRNRMDMIFHSKGLGFRERGKWWKIVDIEKCPISNDKLNLLMHEIRDYFKDVDVFELMKNVGTFRYAVIRTPTEDNSISFVLNSDSEKLIEAIEKIKEYAKVSTANNIIVTKVKPKTDMSISDDYLVVKGKDTLTESFLGKKFIFPVQGFFQNNSKMAEKMLKYVNELLSKYDTNNAHLLDLYGGVGTFGIVNSSLFNDVIIVENVERAIECAKKNIDDNDVKNARAIVLDAKQLNKIELKQPLYVITDPPRSGMHPKTIKYINDVKPEVIVYVSCNVKQLGKDLHKFEEYQIKSAALFDLFPQTPHGEAVIELVRK